jgi:hypothetical protein
VQVAAGLGGERLIESLVQLVLRQSPGGEMLAKLGRGGLPLGVTDPYLES